MDVFSIGDVAARLTQMTGKYIGTHRITAVLRRLAEAGEVPERKAGRQRVILDCDLPAIESEFGITADTANQETAP